MHPPTPTQPNPHPLNGFCTGNYSKWSWNGGFSFLLQVSLFQWFERIIPALRGTGVALNNKIRIRSQLRRIFGKDLTYHLWLSEFPWVLLFLGSRASHPRHSAIWTEPGLTAQSLRQTQQQPQVFFVNGPSVCLHIGTQGKAGQLLRS